jgi:myo-inositol 2-dehydrogenase/D-chiro-inositol 1-dehydrogenase
LLEGKLDAVVIETPPYFHPIHAATAVDAGKHVYLAKPIAVDAPGCQTVAAAGARATAKKQVFLVDFQTRADAHFREAVGLVHKGAMGPLVMAEAWYPWSGGGRGAPPATPEEQLRSWYYVLPLSGDFIVEQSIHSLDLVPRGSSTPIRSAPAAPAATRCGPRTASTITSRSPTRSRKT